VHAPASEALISPGGPSRGGPFLWDSRTGRHGWVDERLHPGQTAIRRPAEWIHRAVGAPLRWMVYLPSGRLIGFGRTRASDHFGAAIPNATHSPRESRSTVRVVNGCSLHERSGRAERVHFPNPPQYRDAYPLSIQRCLVVPVARRGPRGPDPHRRPEPARVGGAE